MSENSRAPWRQHTVKFRTTKRHISDADGWPVATMTDHKNEAAARLLAAAPELLYALEDLLLVHSKPDELLCCNGRDCGCMGATAYQQAEHNARAAIAKAEG